LGFGEIHNERVEHLSVSPCLGLEASTELRLELLEIDREPERTRTSMSQSIRA